MKTTLPLAPGVSSWFGGVTPRLGRCGGRFIAGSVDDEPSERAYSPSSFPPQEGRPTSSLKTSALLALWCSPCSAAALALTESAVREGNARGRSVRVGAP